MAGSNLACHSPVAARIAFPVSGVSGQIAWATEVWRRGGASIMRDTILEAPITTQIVAFICVLMSMIAFPVILLAAREFPSLPHFGREFYLEPADLRHFPFEAVLLGVGFIVPFLVCYAYCFSKKQTAFAAVSSSTAIVFYAACLSLFGEFYPIPLYNVRHACEQTCYPVGLHGIFICNAILAGIVAVRLVDKALRWN